MEIGRGKIFVWDSPSVISAISSATGVRRVTRRLTVTRGRNIDRGMSRKEGKSREYMNRKGGRLGNPRHNVKCSKMSCKIVRERAKEKPRNNARCNRDAKGMLGERMPIGRRKCNGPIR